MPDVPYVAAPTKVMYGTGGLGLRLIPAPFVSISKNYQKTGDGEIVGKLYNIVLNGTIVAYMGSPDSSGNFWYLGAYPPDETIASTARLGAILRKQEAIRNLFSHEGWTFEVQTGNGESSIRCNPRITSIEFPQDIWYDKCEYTITLECDELYGTIDEAGDVFTEYIETASEEWTIDMNEDEAETFGVPITYAVSHVVSAKGKRFYDETGDLVKQPWEYAKDYVSPRLGYDANLVASGINAIPSYYNGVNHVRSENINKKDGSYSVTENWVLASGFATEVFSVATTTELESPYPTVTIEGTVTGYNQRDSDYKIITSKWENAENKYTTSVEPLTFIRAQQFSGLSLNIDPLSETVGKNPIQGTIIYNHEYNTRPLTLISGVRSEAISINDNLGGQLHAEVFVLGRALRGYGPVLQDLSAKAANKRTLSIEILLDPIDRTDRSYDTVKTLFNTSKPSVNPTYSGEIYKVISAANPINNGFTTVFQDQPQENWDVTEFRYSYNTTWTFE